MLRFRILGTLAIFVLLVPCGVSLGQTLGQPPVSPATGDILRQFRLVGVTYGTSTNVAGTLNGHFTWDFTQNGWTELVFFFPGLAASYGNIFTDPVHISTTSVSCSHNSDTTSYDFSLPLNHAFTPTTGASVVIDPPGTSVNNLQAFWSSDNGQTVNVLAITGGSIVPVVPCRADFNNDGVLGVADIFAFLNSWFAHNPAADFNGVNGITVQDIFDFLAAWFAGC